MKCYKGNILTVNKNDEVFEYLVEQNGRIRYVGNDLPKKYRRAELIDLGGRALIPAFADTHQHFASFSVFNAGLNVMEAESNEEILRMAANYAKECDQKLLVAFGASPYSVRERKLVSRAELDRVCPDKPFFMNVFDRLFEVEVQSDGSSKVVPSLCTDYTVSGDGLTYTFTLRDGVVFSNGSALTASDVQYTFERLLTAGGVNDDVPLEVLGGEALKNGEAQSLEGFKVIDDTHFSITLAAPNAGFVAELTGPGVSIVDAETMTSLNPVMTVGRQVAETLRLHRSVSRAEARTETVRMFEKVGIPDPEKRYDCYPHQLSGGLRQRAVIAMPERRRSEN